jgi:putative transcriptional regulator
MAVKVLLQDLRKAKGLSQNELALLTRMSPQNIQKIEQGDSKSMTFSTLSRFCKILGCQPGDLLIYEDEPDDDAEIYPLSPQQLNLGSQKKKTNKSTRTAHQQSLSLLGVTSDIPASA